MTVALLFTITSLANTQALQKYTRWDPIVWPIKSQYWLLCWGFLAMKVKILFTITWWNLWQGFVARTVAILFTITWWNQVMGICCDMTVTILFIITRWIQVMGICCDMTVTILFTITWWNLVMRVCCYDSHNTIHNNLVKSGDGDLLLWQSQYCSQSAGEIRWWGFVVIWQSQYCSL